MKESKKGMMFKGRFCPLWGGLYSTATDAFFRGGLENISRTIKCDDSAAVIVEYEAEERTDV